MRSAVSSYWHESGLASESGGRGHAISPAAAITNGPVPPATGASPCGDGDDPGSGRPADRAHMPPAKATIATARIATITGALRPGGFCGGPSRSAGSSSTPGASSGTSADLAQASASAPQYGE